MNHAALSDSEILLRVRRLANQERKATVELIAMLGEMDARRLYLGEGCSSLFTYCTQELHLSEHAAYGRIEAARAARQWPVVLELLADGSLHLTAVSLLRPHLTAENHLAALTAARHKSKRDVEQIVAALRPKPPVPSSVRKLPTPKAPPTLTLPAAAHVSENLDLLQASAAHSAPSPPVLPRPRADIRPLAPESYKVRFTVSRDTYDKLRQAQDLLRHRIPTGDIAQIFDRAVTLLLADLQRSRHGAVERPRSAQPCTTRGRLIPAAVKREVWARDDGRCAFIGATGRCTERGFLEYHHVVPFADGGATSADNLQLRCRAHNAYEAERWFGIDKEDLLREAPCPFRDEALQPFMGQACVTGSSLADQAADGMVPRAHDGAPLRAGGCSQGA
jgi:hypothetical protein